MIMINYKVCIRLIPIKIDVEFVLVVIVKNVIRYFVYVNVQDPLNLFISYVSKIGYPITSQKDKINIVSFISINKLLVSCVNICCLISLNIKENFILFLILLHSNHPMLSFNIQKWKMERKNTIVILLIYTKIKKLLLEDIIHPKC